MAAPDLLDPDAARGPDARVRAFDLARGLAVLFMVLVHVLAQYGTDAAWATPVGQLVLLLGGPTAAPVFMFLMGASIAFSRRSTVVAIARRGLWLLFLAYTLNVLRASLPATLGLATGFVSTADIAPYTPVTSLLLVDIHQMAGVALLVLAVVAGLGGLAVAGAVRASVAVGLAVAVAVVSPALWGAVTGQPAVDLVLDVLWGTQWYVFFPVFPWIVYPLVGYAYGRVIHASIDRSRLVRRVGLLGVALVAVSAVAVGLSDPLSGMDLFFRPSAAVLAGFIGIVLAWLALADIVVARVRTGRALDLLFGWSARVTSMYCVHWILIGWGVAIVGRRELELPGLAIAMVVVLVVADRITLALPFLRGRRPGPGPRPALPEPVAA